MIKQKIIKLRKEGFSIREICKKLNTSYGTTQRTCSAIKMPNNGLKRYSKLNGLTRNILFKDSLNEIKVRIISNLLFDGAVYVDKYYHYSIMYVNSSKKLISQFIHDMKKIYNVMPSSIENHPTYQRVKYLSKYIYDDLFKYLISFSTSDVNCEIPHIILNGKKSFKQIILQALWENEGSVSYEGRLVTGVKSLKVITQLSKLHNEFGLKHSMKCRNDGMCYIYLFTTKENYKKFIDLELFLRSRITKGHNKGKEKIDALKEHFNKKFCL